jgi:cytochrome c peroxidase
MRKNTTLLTLLTLCLLAACNPSREQNSTDMVLRNTITDALGSDGLASLQMPDSDNLRAIPQDPKNPITKSKVELGKLLFHETGLANKPILLKGENTYSCASCHHAAAGFQAGMAQGIGEGGTGFGAAGEGRIANQQYASKDLDIQMVRSPSALNIAYQKNILWNGQFGATGVNTGTEAQWTKFPLSANHLGYEGTETQAIVGLTIHRMQPSTSLCAKDPQYKKLFQEAFPGQPINNKTAGLAIAAYERTLLANEAPFQKWLRGNTQAMSEEEKLGAVLFFGKAKCYTCHNGPGLANMEFHALGMSDLNTSTGAIIRSGELEKFTLGRAGFTGRNEDMYKFKVPQLYNLQDSPFYGHGASFTSIREVIEYKNKAIAENPVVPKDKLSQEFVPLNLNKDEIRQLTAFLKHGLYDDNLRRYLPDYLPSGQCFPNADPESISDLGCQ